MCSMSGAMRRRWCAMPKTLFCFGFGYTAQRLALRLQPQGWTICGTVRSAERVAAFAAAGQTVVPFDGTARSEAVAALLAGASHVLHSVPPGPEGDAVLIHHGPDLKRHTGLEWLGWLGTTSVYGDRGGEWVDEDSPLTPNLARGDRRAEAERAWLESGLPVHIFRLGGIYGPGRNPFLSLRAGTARRIIKPGQVFSRVHVDDIAAVLEASITAPSPGRIYNVCDDEPAPPQDVVTLAADLLGVDPPPEQPFETADLSPMARSFYGANRRVRNTRIKSELGVRLAYPTYREGLRALLPTVLSDEP